MALTVSSREESGPSSDNLADLWTATPSNAKQAVLPSGTTSLSKIFSSSEPGGPASSTDSTPNPQQQQVDPSAAPVQQQQSGNGSAGGAGSSPTLAADTTKPTASPRVVEHVPGVTRDREGLIVNFRPLSSMSPVSLIEFPHCPSSSELNPNNNEDVTPDERRGLKSPRSGSISEQFNKEGTSSESSPLASTPGGISGVPGAGGDHQWSSSRLSTGSIKSVELLGSVRRRPSRIDRKFKRGALALTPHEEKVLERQFSHHSADEATILSQLPQHRPEIPVASAQQQQQQQNKVLSESAPEVGERTQKNNNNNNNNNSNKNNNINTATPKPESAKEKEIDKDIEQEIKKEIEKKVKEEEDELDRIIEEELRRLLVPITEVIVKPEPSAGTSKQEVKE
jgi:hypothetical protein